MDNVWISSPQRKNGIDTIPEPDAFGVLKFLYGYGYIAEIPVIAITMDSKFGSKEQALVNDGQSCLVQEQLLHLSKVEQGETNYDKTMEQGREAVG